MSNGKLDPHSVAEQVIGGLLLVAITGIVVHTYDRVQSARELANEGRKLVSLTRLSPSRKRTR